MNTRLCYNNNMEKVIALSYELKNLLENDERLLNLTSKEEIMKNDELAMALAYKKDLALDELEFMVNHFSKDSKEVEVAQKKLHEAKLQLDTSESVKDYLKAYSAVRDLLNEVNNTLFSMLNENLCE